MASVFDYFKRAASIDWCFLDFIDFLKDTALLSDEMMAVMASNMTSQRNGIFLAGRILEHLQGYRIPPSFCAHFVKGQTFDVEMMSKDELVILHRLASIAEDETALIRKIAGQLVHGFELQAKSGNPFRLMMRYFKARLPLSIRHTITQFCQNWATANGDMCSSFLAREIDRKFRKLRYFVPESTIVLYSEFYHMLPIKGLFVELHRDLLVQRLLLRRKYTTLADWRLQAITKLPRAGDILADYAESESIVRQFENSLSGIRLSVFDSAFFVHRVIVDGAWPVAVWAALDAFREFYHSKRRHRRLQWDMQLSSCKIVASSVKIFCSAICGIILLVTVRSPKTSPVIAKATGIPLSKVEEICRSLMKLKAVRLDRQNRIEVDLSRLEGRLCVPMTFSLPVSKTPDRSMVVDAKLVKLVKNRGSVPMADLVALVAESLVVPIDKEAVAERVQDLRLRGILMEDGLGNIYVR
jgi:hypothetical protein